MRPGRVVVLASAPFLVLLGVLRTPAPAAPALALTGGEGSATQGHVVVITDGHPQPLVATRSTVRRPAPRAVVAAAPAPRRPAPRRTATTSRPARPAPVRVTTTTVRDAYPWASDTSGGMDTWGFTKRQCVSYVAWRLAQAGEAIDNRTQHWGSALDWDTAAQRLGWAVTTRPSVGAVAQWEAAERSAYWSSPSVPRSDGTYVAGQLGHVAWVVQVYGDGSVLVAQYNGMGDRSFSTMRVRAPRYLVPRG